MTAQFDITTILRNGTWTGVNQPAIKEFVPKGNRPEEADPDFRYKLRFKRIIIIQIARQERDDQSIFRDHESGRSVDEYELTIKTGSYADTKNVYDKMRDILITQPHTSGICPWKVGSMEPVPQRGSFAYTVRVTGYLTGNVRDEGA